MNMPEEINRIITDRLSSWLFCPTQTAVANLHNEGIGLNPNSQSDNKFFQHVLNVGDVMYDAFLLSKKRARASTELPMAIQELTDGFYLATVHRSENTDNPIRLKSIMNALGMIAVKKPVVLPIHPRTRKAITALRIKKNDIKLIDPVGYFDMLRMLDACDAVFTDSGGLQKEAYFAEKLCVTLRDETEWTELVENGFNILAGTTQEKITCAEKKLSTIQVDWNVGLYGDGNAGEKTIEAIAGQ
jgi:UDP-GlcNAc3NAcA epimerase